MSFDTEILIKVVLQSLVILSSLWHFSMFLAVASDSCGFMGIENVALLYHVI